MVNKKLGHEKLDGSKIDWYSVLETGIDTSSTNSSPLISPLSGDVVYAPEKGCGNVKKSMPKPKPLSAEEKEQALLKKRAKEKEIDEKVASKMKEYNYPPIKVINTREAEQTLEDADTEYNLFKVIEDIKI